MVNKNIQMKKKENDSWINLFPLTLSENVFNVDGVSVENEITNLEDSIENIETDLNSTINKTDDLRESLDQMVINVLEFGAVGDGVTDDTQSIQQALDNVIDGGTVYFPKTLSNQYIVTDTLIPKSNTKIMGDITQPCLYFKDEVEKNIVELDNISNIYFENITFQNFESQTGWHLGENKNGVKIVHSDNITFINCMFTEMGGQNGVWVSQSKDLIFERCTFTNHTYAMLSLRSETENILVNECVFDTLTSIETPNTYTIVTGGTNYTDEFEFLTRNLTVTNSKFLNNPRWEGFDSHGIKGLYFVNNYIENVRTGILVGLDQRPNTRILEHDDIYIKNNIIKKGSSNQVGSGISVSGHSNSNNGTGRLAENVVVSENRIVGFGDINSEYTPALNTSNIRYLTLENNVIENSINRAVNMGSVLYGSVVGNKILNTRPNSDNSVIPFRMFQGVYFVDVEKNTIVNNGYGLRPVNRGIRSTNRGMVNYGKNNIIAIDNTYDVQNAQMKGVIESYRVGFNGTFIRNQYGIITHVNTDRYVRSADGTTGLTVTGTQGNRVVKTNESALNHVCEGEEVVIVGGGSGGDDLTAVVKKYIDHHTIELAIDIQTNVTNASVKTLESNWVEV